MSALFELPTSPDTASPRRSRGDKEGLLDGLNPQQQQAVQHTGSPLLIVAGAGSGKTRVLTHRIAHLLAERDVHPGQIMAITFTNKAAAEMRERVVSLVGGRAKVMWVSTFHSMCARVLRRECHHLGLKSSFSIYDADDSRRLVGLVARDLDLDPKRYPARGLAAQISNLKNELASTGDAAAAASNDFERRVAEVYAGYQQRLGTANALDFDDLIMRTVGLLQTSPAVTEHYRRRFRHILVDEYQDTNHAQYLLVRELAGSEVRSGVGEVGEADADGGDRRLPPAELCVVGDADQSIYAFRGASIRNISEFEADYPNARTILLEQNYRSTQTILSAANAVIARNVDRRDKRLWSEAGDGEKIVGYVADNEHDEAAFVAREIDRLVDSGDARNSDVAVFYRTNAQSRVFEDVFMRVGMPYRVVGGMRFYERREVRDALAYLRVLSNPDDTVSLRRILNVPKRGIGDKAEEIVAHLADRDRISFAAALRLAAEHPEELPALASRSQRCIAGFVELLDGLRELADRGEEVHEILQTLLHRTGYTAELEASEDPQDASRVENLAELVTVAREFVGDAAVAPPAEDGAPEPGSLAAFLERVSLVADADSIPDSDQGVVTLMTLHTAKGLEFPVVFCTGWEDGVFPHLRALGDPAELAEERRLAYVGITRARERLYLSRAVVRSAFGQPMTNPASRFLDDVPPELTDWRYSSLAGPSGARSAPMGRAGFGRRSPTAGSGDRGSWRPPAAPAAAAISLQVGDRVNHDKYGLGTVIATEGADVRANVTIDFGSSGTVRLMLIGGVPLQKL